MKKLLALFLAAVLTLSLMIVPTVSADDMSSVTELPAYVADTTLDKTEYKISTADGFTNLKNWVAAGETFVEKTVYLAANNLETTVSIGSSDYAFGGIFDGNGNSVKITIQGQGLFAYASGATIQNLTIAEGSTVSSTAGQLAAVVGTANNNVTLLNVVNYANIPSSVYATGGLVGIVNSGNLTVTNCANHGTINGGDGVGGIVGRPNNANGIINITNTVNTGVVDATKNVGGLVGCVNVNSATLVIAKCVNSGKISSDTTSGIQWSGGIVGRTLSGVQISNCQNHGEIEGWQEVGGLIGTLQGGDATKNYVKKCLNTGTVTFHTGNKNVGEMAGGIVGRIISGAGAKIEDCVNYGYVYSSSGQGVAGTILGASQSSNAAETTLVTITNCTNYGKRVGTNRDTNSAFDADLVGGWNGNCMPTVTNSVDKQDYTTQMVGYQIAKVSDTNEKADLRIIASVDSADHTNVGFNVVVKDANGNKVAEVKDYKCQTIYSHLSALGVNDAISASAYRNNGDADDGYLFAIVIQDLPVENIEETYYFEITTFVDGEATNCDTASFGVAQPAQSGN